MMSGSSKDDIISRLQNNVAELLTKYREAVAARDEAENLLSSLHDEHESLKLQLKEIKARYDMLITSQGFVMTEDDVKNARLRVNRLVREIDKCISLLNE